MHHNTNISFMSNSFKTTKLTMNLAIASIAGRKKFGKLQAHCNLGHVSLSMHI